LLFHVESKLSDFVRKRILVDLFQETRAQSRAHRLCRTDDRPLASLGNA
jgi:hypothetical protein